MQVTLKNANDVLPECRGICVCQVKGHGRWLVLSIVQGDVGGKPSVNNKTAWIVLLAEDRTPAIWMWEGMRHLNRLEFCVTKSRATRSRSHFFRPGAMKTSGFCILPCCFVFHEEAPVSENLLGSLTLDPETMRAGRASTVKMLGPNICGMGSCDSSGSSCQCCMTAWSAGCHWFLVARPAWRMA